MKPHIASTIVGKGMTEKGESIKRIFRFSVNKFADNDYLLLLQFF